MKMKVRKSRFSPLRAGHTLLPATKASAQSRCCPSSTSPSFSTAWKRLCGRLRQIIIIHGTWQGCIEGPFDVSYELERILGDAEKNGYLLKLSGKISDESHVASLRQKAGTGPGPRCICMVKNLHRQ